MLGEDLEDLYKLEQNLLLLDSFQLFNLISSLSFNDINRLISAQSSEIKIVIYYRLPNQLRRKFIKSSIGLKTFIKNHESKHNISLHLAPAIVFNTFDLIPDIMANKIKNNSHLLEFFIKDFMVLQDIKAKYKGILYLRDIIKLIHNKKFTPSIIPRIIVNYKPRSNQICNTIDDDSDQLIFNNYFTVENESHHVLGAINIDYVLDDYNLVQEIDTMPDQIFYLQEKQKFLNMMFVLVSTVISTFIIGSLASIMHFPAKVIIICDTLTAINDGVLIIAAQDDLETHEIIFYSLILAAIMQFLFFWVYIWSGLSVAKAGAIGIIGATNSVISMALILVLINRKYNIGYVILAIDVIIITTMFILNKVLQSNVIFF